MYSQKYTYYNIKKSGKNDSKFEAGKARELGLLQKAGEIKSFQEQVKIPLVVNGYLIANYYIDFVIEHNDGTTEYLETKGYATDTWRLKWKLFEALYSDMPNVVLAVEYQGKGRKPKARKIK